MNRATVPLRADRPGRLLRRYKRFLADVELESGEVVTAHCPNPGSMRGLDTPGAAVRCSCSEDPRRKLPFGLEMVRAGRTWVGVHTGRANALASRVLERGALRELSGYARVQPEVPLELPGEPQRSRLDFALHDHPHDPRPAWVEVKSVTLAAGRRARFPDAVTARGARHMKALACLAERGERAVLLFVVQRADCDGVEPAEEIDPMYAAALRDASKRGVEVLAIGARVTAREIRAERTLPVWL